MELEKFVLPTLRSWVELQSAIQGVLDSAKRLPDSFRENCSLLNQCVKKFGENCQKEAECVCEEGMKNIGKHIISVHRIVLTSGRKRKRSIRR